MERFIIRAALAIAAVSTLVSLYFFFALFMISSPIEDKSLSLPSEQALQNTLSDDPVQSAPPSAPDATLVRPPVMAAASLRRPPRARSLSSETLRKSLDEWIDEQSNTIKRVVKNARTSPPLAAMSTTKNLPSNETAARLTRPLEEVSQALSSDLKEKVNEFVRASVDEGIENSYGIRRRTDSAIVFLSPTIAFLSFIVAFLVYRVNHRSTKVVEAKHARETSRFTPERRAFHITMKPKPSLDRPRARS
jgi:hypothetical protein